MGSIRRAISQSLQHQAKVTLASLGCYHKSGHCAKSCAHRSLRFCSHRAASASIRLLASWLQSCDWSRGISRFVKLTLKVVMQNDGNLVDVILLYQHILKVIYNFCNHILFINLLIFAHTELKTHSIIFLPTTLSCPLHLSKILIHK